MYFSGRGFSLRNMGTSITCASILMRTLGLFFGNLLVNLVGMGVMVVEVWCVRGIFGNLWLGPGPAQRGISSK